MPLRFILKFSKNDIILEIPNQIESYDLNDCCPIPNIVGLEGENH